MEFEVCSNEFQMMDYCTSGERWSYIDEYLFHLVYPDLQRVEQIKGSHTRKMAYVASYLFLINYIARHRLFPKVSLYKDVEVETKDVDMVIDIGNSRTTALLIEESSSFNQVRHLELVDYTCPLKHDSQGTSVRKYSTPFDMRLVFRRADFGDFGIKDSKQFVYPSLVRLGQEASRLMHNTSCQNEGEKSLSTYSSPKRYLWDWKPSREEWKFLVLDGERDQHVLNLQGITNQLKSDGQFDPEGKSGTTYHYSRRSLMTFAFLEMLVQADVQINGVEHRSAQTGFGEEHIPRRVKRMIITCPTAMSKVEREALVRCAKEASQILANFKEQKARWTVEVVPNTSSGKDADGHWYYDEATCAQLVYMYGEAGFKYKGNCGEFFKLYGKTDEGDTQPAITIGSLDIGAGTSDLMISKYTYETTDLTTITPAPLFYDSYYFAGDDMLYALIKNIMLLDERSAFNSRKQNAGTKEYRQKIKNFFGKDYNGQTAADRKLRRDFNIQYSIPLMYHFLELLNNGSGDCQVRYDDVFRECPPNIHIVKGFEERTGIDITQIIWDFNREKVAEIVGKEFEPLLKKIATVMYSYSCDIILLSGRPASLPPIRNLFLKYYPVAPNRLIVLNNYYVGDWYPFGGNSGHIKDAKTVVAIGGVIGHYASELSNLHQFAINLDKLKSNLKSTIHYVESTREGMPRSYTITPEKDRGTVTVNSLPMILKVKQLELDNYPSRPLYTIDFNTYKIGEHLRKKALTSGNKMPTEGQVAQQVKATTDTLRHKMPFKIEIERDADDYEKLTIIDITDNKGEQVADSNIEIHIQSLGSDEHYWLDSGEFDF